MSTAIATIDTSHKVPKGSRLDKSERELATAMIAEMEAFCHQAVILERIKDDKEFNDAGFSSFDTYMNERMPQGIRKSQAWRLIAAKNIRILLPDLPISPKGEKYNWTERAIRPLTHKDFTKADVKRIGKKIATQVKSGFPLTESLVKKICDEDRGVDKQKKQKKSVAIAAADTPAETIERMTVEVNLWLKSLGMVPGDFWLEAEEDEPGCVKELISALSDFAKFLRS